MLRERWGLITSRRIIFTPSVDLKDELATTGILITCYDRTTGILITCYDRTGKEVKRVTSTSGEVEDSDSGGSGTVTEENGSGTEVHSGSGIIPTPTDPEDDQPSD